MLCNSCSSTLNLSSGRGGGWGVARFLKNREVAQSYWWNVCALRLTVLHLHVLSFFTSGNPDLCIPISTPLPETLLK